MNADFSPKSRPDRTLGVTVGRTVLGVALLGGVAVGGLYLLRKPIAEHYLNAELAKRGVRGSYQLTRLDPYHQRLEHVVIGDPAHPDLTADWIELSTTIGFGTAAVDLVRAGGVRVSGVLTPDGAVHFGALDKFRSTAPGPFTLPDIGLDLRDARVALGTPYGAVNGRLDGSGNLAQNFTGKLGVQTAAMKLRGCAISPMDAQLTLNIVKGRTNLLGPIRGDSFECTGVQVTHPLLNVAVVLTPDFKGAKGELVLSTDRIATQYLDTAAQVFRVTRGTPVEPFGQQYAQAVTALSAGVTMATDFAHDPAQGTLLSGMRMDSHSKALIYVDPGGQITVSPAGKVGIQVHASLKGGGFPETQVTLAGSPTRFTGTATLAPLAAPNTRLVTTPITFSHDARGTQIATAAAFDGPVGGGLVHGLALPIVGLIRPSGGFTLANPCTPIRFDSLTISTVTLGKTATRACLANGQVVIDTPRIAGTYGGAPFALAAGTALYSLSGNALTLGHVTGQLGTTRLSAADVRYASTTRRFTGTKIVAQSGATGHAMMVTADALNGALAGGTATGRFTNAAGQLPGVPLALTNATGTWHFAQGALALKSTLTVADTDAAKRFEPLVSPDVTLRYANGLITASGTLNEPKSGAFVSRVSLTHSMKSNNGDAIIAIKELPLLNFGKALQPEALTRITLGVVANLRGAVSGEGHIQWSDKGVTSNGRFATDHMDLAAAFGPVKGLKGEIVFTDLLGMVTAPHQQVTIESVNPGVNVENGEIRFRMLPGNKAEIEGGTFPLAGGQLILEPTVLDLSEAAERRLTFRVVGVDAGKFLNEYKFEDIAATGIFDGELPLIFDSRGGRIEAGRLAVRDAGGTVSYVGPVSNASLGTFGKLAFDALKSIKYRGLTIDLQGPLDGEMVTLVKLTGTNQAPIAAKKSFLLKQITGIPFKFNIRITAPFRSLMTSARNLQDPSDLVQQGLPKNLKVSAPPPPKTPVHRADSPIQK